RHTSFSRDWSSDVCSSDLPGLAPLTLSERARERLVERSPSWYLDLRMLGRYTGPATGSRTYHHTAPVAMVRSLHAGLGAILDEGGRKSVVQGRSEELGGVG